MSSRNTISKRLLILFFIISCSVFVGCNNIFLEKREAPKDLKIFSITSDSAEISWSSINKASLYDVMWKIKGDNKWAGSMCVETNHCQLNNLLYNQEYVVKVAALYKYKSDNYLMSDYISSEFKTLEDIPLEGELARPNNFKASFNKEKTAITISWDAVEGASYYDINIREDKLNFYEPGLNILKTVPAEKTEFVYTGALPKNKKIIIKVAARNSDFSNNCRWSWEITLDN